MAFTGTGLTNISIPSSVERIDSWAFNWCSSLTDIYIDVNPNLNFDYDFLFDGNSLENMTLAGNMPNNYYYGWYNEENFRKVVLYVPRSLYNQYASTEPWNKFAAIIPLDDDVINNPENNKPGNNNQGGNSGNNNQEGGSTGIDSFKSDNNKVVVYNLKGQRTNTQSKGINIINGKKVVIK